MPPAKRERLYSSSEMAELLQVDTSSVVKWVNDGLLFSYRTPGGHRRLRAGDVLAFVRAQGMYIPPELLADRPRMLFVDADGHALGAMKRAMKPFEGQVELATAQGGLEAVLKIGLTKPDIVVVDAADSIGVEALLDLVRREPETAGVEVIVLADRVTADLTRRLEERGAHVRERPVAAEDLVALATDPNRAPARPLNSGKPGGRAPSAVEGPTNAEPGQQRPRRSVDDASCRVPGCGRTSTAKRLCPTHYQKARRLDYGDDLSAAQLANLAADGRATRPVAASACRVPGCKRPSAAKRLCQTHYQKARRLDYGGDGLSAAQLAELAADGRTTRWANA